MPHLPGHEEPVASTGLGLESGGATQLQDLLSGGPAGRRQATGAAFEQLFTGQLSGNQQDLLQQLLKNRLARGLRGAAAEHAKTQLEQQFRASNRVAGAEFIGQALGANVLPQLGQNAALDLGGLGGTVRNQAGFTDLFGTQRAGDTAGLGALTTEIAGLRAEGLQSGGAAVNRRIEAALAAAGGDRQAAFGNLFGTASLPGLQDLLDPSAAIGRQIGGIEGQLRSQFEELGQVGGTTFQGNNRFANLGAGQITGVNLEVTDDLLSRLGLRSFNEAGGFQNVLAGETGQSLAQRARDALGIDLPDSVEAQIVSGFQDRGNGRREGTAFLAFGGGDIADQAELLMNLTSSGFARERTFSEGIRQNIQTLRELQGLRSQIGGSIQSTDLLSRRQQELQGALAGPSAEQTTRSVLNPLTGNRRQRVSEVRETEAANRRRIEELRGSISEINRFRTELFSPAVPFFT